MPRLSIGYNFVLSHPQRGTIQRRFAYGASGGLELLAEWRVAEDAAEEAARLGKVLMKGGTSL